MDQIELSPVPMLNVMGSRNKNKKELLLSLRLTLLKILRMRCI